MGGIMLDSTNPQAVIDAIKGRRTWRNMAIKAAAGYIDGNFAWPSAAFTQLRALGVTAVEITVTGQASADAIRRAADDEPGDLTPAQTAEFAANEHKDGRTPLLYTDRDNKPATASECRARGLAAGKDFGWWVATLDGTFTDTDGSDLRTAPGVWAIQFAGSDRLGIDADASVITTEGNGWFHIEPSWEEQALDLSTRLTQLIHNNQ